MFVRGRHLKILANNGSSMADMDLKLCYNIKVISRVSQDVG